MTNDMAGTGDTPYAAVTLGDAGVLPQGERGGPRRLRPQRRADRGGRRLLADDGAGQDEEADRSEQRAGDGRRDQHRRAAPGRPVPERPERRRQHGRRRPRPLRLQRRIGLGRRHALPLDDRLRARLHLRRRSAGPLRQRAPDRQEARYPLPRQRVRQRLPRRVRGRPRRSHAARRLEGLRGGRDQRQRPAERDQGPPPTPSSSPRGRRLRPPRSPTPPRSSTRRSGCSATPTPPARWPARWAAAHPRTSCWRGSGCSTGDLHRVPAQPGRRPGLARHPGAQAHHADVPGPGAEQPHRLRTVAGGGGRRGAWSVPAPT